MAPGQGAAQAMDRAAAAFSAGRLDEAAALCAAILHEEPAHFYALHLSSVIALREARWHDALDLATRALAARPGNAEVRANRGAALRRLGRAAEALADYDAVLAVHPAAADARNNRGVALAALERHDEAIGEYLRALQAAPGYTDAFYNLGVSLAALNRHEEAVQAATRALMLDPSHARARWNRGMSLLALGRFPEGFADYEARRALGDARSTTRDVMGTPWTGREPLEGRTLLLLAEQGFGDALMFSRFASVLAKRGARVILEAPSPVAALLATLPHVERAIATGETAPPFDYYCPLASLPALLGTRLEDIAPQEPPLRAPPELVQRWSERVSGLPRPRVAIAWSGGLGHGTGDPRSIPLPLWQRLREVPATFISVQKQIDAADGARIAAAPPVHRYDAELADFRDTAALLEQADLVVTIDTAVAHLAGAMGKPTWVLLPFAADWRWLVGREDSPWYPSVRLFRQPRPGDWASVMTRVAQELRRTLDGSGEAPVTDTTAAPLARARSLLATGRVAEAEALARDMTRREPSQPEWLHLLGAAQHLAGRHGEAAATLEAAARAAPADARVRNTLGAALMALDDLDGARSALEEALRLDAADAEARFNHALLLERRGDMPGALRELEHLARERPDHLPARLERSLVLLRSGEAAAAWDALSALLAQAPNDARLLLAAASARAALGDRDEAAVLASRAASLAPDQPELRGRAADVLAACGRVPEARTHYAAIAAVRPRDVATLEKLAAATQGGGDGAEAIELYRRILALEPRARASAQNLAVALHEAGERDEALRVLERAIADGHDDAEMLGALVTYKAMECDWRGLAPLVERLRERNARDDSRPAYPQDALYHASIGAQEQRSWASRWAASRWKVLAPRPPWHARSGRLRVGFLSGDFHAHAVAWLIAGLIEAHDRERLEFAAYSYAGDDRTEIRERLRRSFDRFVEVGALDDAAAARRIRDDGIDILVDLGGHTRSGRLGVLAHRPAAVQGHFLGYPGTTGAPFVDFFVADGETVPAALEHGFSETVVRVRGCYQPNDRARPAGASGTRAAHGLPAGGIVFCSFNQPVKITEGVFSRWCDLLDAVHGSVLWLTALDLRAEANLRREAARRAIDPARLVFAPRAGTAVHLARLRHADIALDTFPYTSHTTASDVLWAGVPLVTVRGETFASRVAASVLRAAGCGQWIFDDPDAAFEATLALARSRPMLAAARAHAATAAGSPLFDALSHARAFDELLLELARDASRRFAAGELQA
ncbi:MAG TPA: tetratricopeptide repeat protein [Usitatibacter sp.]|jgi:predicted O-linked N-acetylglucosamine transferase (SPINDLY family)|nr:tetratricopeptide repeat protein [Usitatibacter sp.]